MKTIGYMAFFLFFLFINTTIYATTLTETPLSIKKTININTATAKQLCHVFRGIGPKRSEAIVMYRQQHGRFQSLTELAKVKGIGKNFVKSHLDELRQVFILE